MKLTKYEHACFTVEKDDKILVVDPGGFTSDFISPENVIAVVITHAHGDHFDHDQLSAIIDKNPDAIIIADPDITSKIEVFQTQSVNAGDSVSVGPFDLEFFGGEHAVIIPSIPIVPNLGVLINELIYYPGDSFAVPGKPVDVLALPIGAPWLKISEVIDFLQKIKPRLAFPTHDAVLSDIGKSLPDMLIPGVTEKVGIEYKRLKDPIEV
jgi:L-ascorbate metabolism protein UlaG (beta-lactamase superfamily)